MCGSPPEPASPGLASFAGRRGCGAKGTLLGLGRGGEWTEPSRRRRRHHLPRKEPPDGHQRRPPPRTLGLLLVSPLPPQDDMRFERRRCIQEERLQHANLHLFGLHRHFHSMLLAFKWLDRCPIHISSTVIVGSRT